MIFKIALMLEWTINLRNVLSSEYKKNVASLYKITNLSKIKIVTNTYSGCPNMFTLTRYPAWNFFPNIILIIIILFANTH